MRRLVYVALLVLAACGDDPKSSADTADTVAADSADGTGTDTPDVGSDAAETIAPDAPDIIDTLDTPDTPDTIVPTDLPDTTEQPDVTADGDDSDDGDVASDAADTSPPAPSILRRAVRSVAGFGAPDGPIAAASIGRPQSLATLADGSLVFADGSYQTLRRVDDQGVVSTIAGSGSVGGIGDGGPATEAQLAVIYGGEMVVDDDGLIYLSDFENHRVRVINPTAGGLRACGGVEVAAGAIETVAGSGEMGFGGEGSPAVSALLEYPRGITFWNGDLVFADIHNCRIRRVRCADGIIETVAGNGGWPYYNEDGTVTVYWREGEPTEAADFGDGPDAREALVGSPSMVVVAPDGALLVAEWAQGDLVSDYARIRRITAEGAITTVAGGPLARAGDSDTSALSAGFGGNIKGMVFDVHDNLFIAESGGFIRRIDPQWQVVTTVMGGRPGTSRADVGGAARDALVSEVGGLVWRGQNLYYADSGTGRIRYLEPAVVDAPIGPDAIVREVGSDHGLKLPYNLALDGGNDLFVMPNWDPRVLRVDRAGGGVSTLVNEGNVDGTTLGASAGASEIGAVVGLAFDDHGNAYFGDIFGARLLRVDAIATDGGRPRVLPSSPVRVVAELPTWVVDRVAIGDGHAFITDPEQGLVLRVDLATGAVDELAGDPLRDGSGVGGPSVDAAPVAPQGLAYHEGVLYVADEPLGRVWMFDLASGLADAIDIVSAYPDDCPWCTQPRILAVVQGFLFVGDPAYGRVLRIDLADPFGSQVNILNGPGAQLGFVAEGLRDDEMTLEPTGLAGGADGKLYVASLNMNRVWRIGAVDLLPDLRDNVVDPTSTVPIEVAFLSGYDFDATSIDPVSVRVAGAAALEEGTSERDVDGDGRLDLVVSVRPSELALTAGQRELEVRARTRSGADIVDADFVSVKE